MERSILFADRKCGGINPQRQAGAVLLIILLVVTGIAACLFVRKLSAGLILAAREYRTTVVLNEAREALIGYAVSYPDKINPDFGPGYLPCPDRNNDGATDAGGCSLSGHTSIGRFPYKTLELEHLRDGQGESLWYVVADNFRNNPKLEPLNSDTAGNLTVDVLSDIAAIVLTPGPPLLSQDRNAGPDNIANYLEDDNADFDAAFTTHDTGSVNDRLVFITRQDLMQAVERRVLGEVSRRLRQYQTAYHAFPWLSPYDNPAVSVFHALLDAEATPGKGWQGHIAFHPFNWATRPSRMSGANPFPTDIIWTWGNISNAIVSSSGTVDAFCVVNLDCATGPYQHVTGLASPVPVQCMWTDKETVECATANVTRTTSYTYPLAVGCSDGTLVRTYTINFPPYRGTVTVHDPTAAAYRTREVLLNGALPSRTDAVQITDVYSGPVSASCNYGSVTTGAGSMSFTTGTTGKLGTGNIHYDLDIKAGEMPEWFFKNDWHTLVYVAYAESETLPGAPASVCNAADNCLVLNGAGNPQHASRALALVAGRALAGEVRPAAQLSAYFESANSIVDEIFSQGANTSTFNDQAKVIATP
jgi:hypothetical protein